MKKRAKALMVLIPLLSAGICWGEMIPDEFISYPQGRVSGLTGLTMIKADDEFKPFWRLHLQPELNLDRIGIGLDLVLLYNPDVGIRAEDGEKWNELSDFLRMIRYIRYGGRGEVIFLLYGALDNVFIGNGLIMGGYSNYDRRGLRLELNSEVAGVETVLNNISEPSLLGGRGYIRPLLGMDLPLLNRLTIGGTYITDIDPNPYEEDEEPFTVYGFDLGLPILKSKLIGIRLYNEAAFIKGHGKGNAVGIGFDLPMDARFRVEYRLFSEDFAPTPFNYIYEQVKYDPNRKVESILNSKPLKGVFSFFAWGIPRKLFVWASFEDYDNETPRVQAEFIETDLVEKISIRGRYTKIGIDGFKDIFDLDERSAFTLRIGYQIVPPFEIVVVHDYKFRKKEDGEGYETIHKVSFELGVSMSY